MAVFGLFPLLIRCAALSCPSDLSGLEIKSTTHKTLSTKCTFSVSYCIFIGISGTAIMIQESQSSVYLDNSLFESCTNFVNQWSHSACGGAGCYLQAASTSVTRCCGYKCSAGYRGQFYESEPAEPSASSNTCTDVCVFLCGERTDKSQDSIAMEGNVIFERVNCSWNIVIEDGAGLECCYVYTHRISQVSVTNYKGDSVMTLYTELGNGNCFMFNIINNTVVKATDKAGLVNFVGNWRLSNVFFFGNTGTQVMRHPNWSPGGGSENQALWEASNMTLVDCVSDVEITGEKLEFVNHVVDTDAFQTHIMNLLPCSYPSTALFTEIMFARSRSLKIHVFSALYMVHY